MPMQVGNLNIQQASSFAAQAMACNLDLKMASKALRANTLLSPDEWKMLDAAVVNVAKTKMGVLTMLKSNGLRRPLGGLGVILDTWQTQSGMTEAEIGMNPSGLPEFDRLNFELAGVPIPVISKAFMIPIRELMASRRNNHALDTQHIEAATDVVLEAAENLVVNGSSIKVGTYSIPGLLTEANINTTTATGDWGTAANSYTSVGKGIRVLEALGYYGPYGIAVNGTQYSETMLPSSTENYIAIRKRILDIESVKEMVPSSKVVAGTCVIYQLEKKVIDLAEAEALKVIPWKSPNEMVIYGQIIYAMAPRVKSDQQSQSGICEITGC